jgi:hypothetical protein
MSTMVHYIHDFLTALCLFKIGRTIVPIQFSSTIVDHSFHFCFSQFF